MRTDEYARKLDWIYKGVDAGRSHASHTLGQLLPALVAAFRCRTVIEVGICEAFTTAVLGRAVAAFHAADGVLVTCDLGRESCARAERALGSLSCAHSVYQCDSREMDWAAALREHGRHHADLVLVDGSHEYDVVRIDIDRTRRVLRTRGLMVLHDYAPEYPGVLNAVNEFQAAAHWRELCVPYEPDSGSSPAIILQRCI